MPNQGYKKKIKSVPVETSFPHETYHLIQHVVKVNGAFLKDTDLIRTAVKYWLEVHGYKIVS